MRLTHWAIAAAVLLNALVTKGGSLAHVSIGWTAMAVLLLRLLRGEGPRHYPSHNPAGALMVGAFWLMLSVVIATGLVMTSGATPMQVAADQAAVASGDRSVLIRKDSDADKGDSAFGTAAEGVHDVVANLLLILAALHLAGVFVEGRLMRRSLLAPMLVGSPMLLGSRTTRRK